MDRQRLQRGTYVHRAVHCLSWRFVRCPPCTANCSKLFHAPLSAAASDPQLHVAHYSVGACRTNFRNVLSADAHLCAPKYSGAIPSVYSGTVCNVRGRSRQHCSFPLRVVSRSSFVPLDVLEFRPAYAGHACVHLLRNSRGPTRQEARHRAQLCRISVCECRLRDVVCGARPGPEAGLVAVGAFQRTLWRSDCFPARLSRTEVAKPKSARRSALPAAVEHYCSEFLLGTLPLLPAGNHYPRAASAGGSRF